MPCGSARKYGANVTADSSARGSELKALMSAQGRCTTNRTVNALDATTCEGQSIHTIPVRITSGPGSQAAANAKSTTDEMRRIDGSFSALVPRDEVEDRGRSAHGRRRLVDVTPNEPIPLGRRVGRILHHDGAIWIRQPGGADTRASCGIPLLGHETGGISRCAGRR